MKRLTASFVLAVILVAIFVGVVAADGPNVVNYRYILVDDPPPIPTGEVVEFVDLGGQLVIKWDERIRMGHVTHYYTFERVDFSLEVFGWSNSSSSSFRNPQPGDIAVIIHYGDFEDVLGNWARDGVVDRVSLVQYRQWTPQEIALLDLARQFYGEAVEKNFIYLSYAADCPPTEFRVNGQKAQSGPYGGTLIVPEEGGLLSAWYAPGEGPCASGNPDGTTRWDVMVKPGDMVIGTETVSVRSTADRDPWYFCNTLEWMRPQWQPKRIPVELKGYCDVWSRHDGSTRATLAGLGFWEVSTSIEGATPFVFYGREENLPSFTWKAVPSIDLGPHWVYMASVEYDAWRGKWFPVVRMVDGSPADEMIVGWGGLVMFVPTPELTEYAGFDWQNYSIFRIVRSGWSEVTIHKVVWQ